MANGGRRPGAGRKKIKIDLARLTRLSAKDLTVSAAARRMKIKRATLQDRIQHDPEVMDAWEDGKAILQETALDNLQRLAKKQVAAAIFLVKNVRGYKDNPDTSLDALKVQVLHIVFDNQGKPIEDKDTLAPPLPDPPNTAEQNAAEEKAKQQAEAATAASQAACQPTPAN